MHSTTLASKEFFFTEDSLGKDKIVFCHSESSWIGTTCEKTRIVHWGQGMGGNYMYASVIGSSRIKGV